MWGHGAGNGQAGSNKVSWLLHEAEEYTGERRMKVRMQRQVQVGAGPGAGDAGGGGGGGVGGGV